ncbi:exported hypothetical protein [Candidatus Terasakiella magnetica]|uniref:TadE-like domain-containing protein n=1 Tax=Candidatus Terasakiella magnetica TaxID=1867952 RepID=A0A1C3REP9_9PROT|nr:TadE/TadG family type IV pilus assembly protein [Candidatus Terasakiella magnetica]SCA55721.1 exported hypothetical protein [Candidatus Terasakiella magnetica]
MWTIKSRFIKDEKGVVLPSLGLFLPLLMLMSFAAIEVSLIVFEWHRTGEATRRAARYMAIEEPVADLSSFVRGSSVVCQGSSAGGVNCSSGAGANISAYGEMVAQMQAIQPAIQSEHISITYSDSGLGEATTPGGILPMVSVRVENLQKPLVVIGGFMGMPDVFTYPAFMTNQIANGIGPTS